MKKLLKCFWPFLLGILICNIYLMVIKETDILNKEIIRNTIINMSSKLSVEPYNKDYLLYILKLRGGQLILLSVAKYLKKGKVGLVLWLGISGIGIGVGAYCFCSQLGLLGGFFLIGFLFPHYFLYLFAYYLVYNVDYCSQFMPLGCKGKKGYIVQKMVAFVVVIIGIYSEFYVNPYILKFFEKIIYIKNYKI